MSDQDEPYRTGRGRPPLHTRFSPGKSGNPRGRPRGRKSMDKMLSELLDAKVTVGVGDRRRSMTRLEAILMQQVQSALKGDRKAVQFLLATRSVVEAVSNDEPGISSAADEAIIERFLAKQPGPNDGAP